MKRGAALRAILLTASALAGIAIGYPADAQSVTAARIDSIEQQIKSLQSELSKVKSDLATRDRALKAAQDRARVAQDSAKAAEDQAAAASAQALQANQTAQRVASAPAAAAPGAPPAPSGPPLPPGTFRLGGITVTLGGFAAGETVYRSRNQAASVDTNFNTGIPLPNSPNYNTGEFRATAQQSRFSLLAQGKVDNAQTLTSYMETDFLSAGSSSNSNQSNSYTLRLRQFWAGYDNTNWGLHILGGQAWSLATMYQHGLIPRQENVPLTIDAQYVVGFNWERQAQLRVTKDWDDHKLWTAVSLENPQTTFGSSGGPNCLTGAQSSAPTGGGTLEYAQCGGSNVNTVQAYSDNIAPDVIAKVAYDPGFGHYELYGLLRFLNGRVSVPGGGSNYTTTGEGVGGGMILPLVPNVLNFQVSGLVGKGVGRYGTAQLPDATFDLTGRISPLSAYSVMGGLVAHPIPSVDIYAYGGTEQVGRKAYTSGTVNAGYGNPNLNLSGCDVELGSCSANTSGVYEGTLGAWWRFLKGPFGTAQVGAQYEYIHRDTFSGMGATKGSTVTPSSDENAFLFSFRYLPFQ